MKLIDLWKYKSAIKINIIIRKLYYYKNYQNICFTVYKVVFKIKLYIASKVVITVPISNSTTLIQVLNTLLRLNNESRKLWNRMVTSVEHHHKSKLTSDSGNGARLLLRPSI